MLRKWLEENDVTAREFAAAFEVPVTVVDGWLSRGRTPTWRQQWEILVVTGINPKWWVELAAPVGTEAREIADAGELKRAKLLGPKPIPQERIAYLQSVGSKVLEQMKQRKATVRGNDPEFARMVAEGEYAQRPDPVPPAVDPADVRYLFPWDVAEGYVAVPVAHEDDLRFGEGQRRIR